jgi:hypothetical protein
MEYPLAAPVPQPAARVQTCQSLIVPASMNIHLERRANVAGIPLMSFSVS